MNVSESLRSYHLNQLDEPGRFAAEELLLDSPAAVMEFIAIKRECEVAKFSTTLVGPSPQLGGRLRQAVARDYAAARPRFKRLAPWLAVAAAAAIVIAVLLVERPAPVPSETLRSRVVDGAEPNLGTL